MVRVPGMATMTNFPAETLAGSPAFRHSSLQIGSFRAGRCSQGGVKVPTGGKGDEPKPASAFPAKGRVSRFGVNPKPTVKVRMKENGCRDPRLCAGLVVPCALILVLNEESHESDVA